MYLEWLDAQHENFPDADAEHPDVGGGGESTEVDGLRGHPLDGELAPGRLHKNHKVAFRLYSFYLSSHCSQSLPTNGRELQRQR